MADPTFLSELEDYLRRVATLPADSDPPPSVAWSQELLVRVLERVEARSRKQPNVAGLLESWQAGDRIIYFVRQLDSLLRAGFAQRLPQAERLRLVEVGLLRHFGVAEKLKSAVRTAALDHLVEAAVDRAKQQARAGAAAVLSVADYATAIRATRVDPQGRALTSIGRVFLDLVGKDAVRWLLHIEAAQSIGPRDPWRLSRELAADLRATPKRWLYWGEDEFPYSSQILDRLAAIGIIEIDSDDDRQATAIAVSAVGLVLLAELEQTDSPLAVLASTLCSDLVVSAVETAAGGGAIPAAFAAEATARQARMVAHEIRNTLVPVRSTLDSLYREVLVDAPDQVLKKRRPLIDRGVSRVFDFVEQLVRVASLAAIPPEPFDPAPAIRDAVAAVDAGAGISVKVLLGTAALPFVVGRRDRFVTALVNLIRNAIQHGGAGLTQIRLLAEPLDRGRALRLTIDDNGDGVPERMREAIFTDGISLSSDGTGLGLALVREVFERELKGVVVCEESPLGGARFRLRTPAAGVNG